VTQETQLAQSGNGALAIKPEARILDTTAGNRNVWLKNENPNIIFIDIEPELEVKPDQVIDCTNTPFPNNYFFTIFFDPPHWWGDEIGENIYALRNWNDANYFNKKYGTNRHVSYYDKFKTKTQLLSFLNKASKEFYRILAQNGMLWVKWVDAKIDLDKILPFFRDWDELLRIHVGSPKQTNSEMQAYWLLFMKKDRPSPQFVLSAFCEKGEEK